MQSHPSVQKDVSLKHFNTFGVDAKARYFAVAQTQQEFGLLLSQEPLRNLPIMILGEGSNILFTQNYNGLIIKNAIHGIQRMAEDENHIWLKVGAGENWHGLVMHCIQQNYSGIENLSLIPGTVGAAPIQNIGAYGVELSDVFDQLEALDLTNGTMRHFTLEECQFGYRDSVFKNTYKNQFAILSVTLRLDKKPKFNLEYGNIKETLKTLNLHEINAKAISDAVIHIRRSKLPDPKVLGNAGSFFKNPLIPSTHFTELQQAFSAIPHFPTKHANLVKISAAWLIEQCGWKGKRLGSVGTYEKQPLVLVNYNADNGAEILALAQQIQQSVREKFSVQLTPEVNLI